MQTRRRFIGNAILAGTGLALGFDIAASQGRGSPALRFDPEEITLDALQEGMRAGRLTARSIVEAYLGRIEALDRRGPGLGAIIEINPDAGALAEALDREREIRGPRGPLHGIPVVIKDNIGTADGMTTTAGSLALQGHVPEEDAFLVRRLREAGAIILAKANLSEWANFRSSRSSSGWSARGGQCRNPYALDRNPCGSSSGSAVAVSANLAPLAVGTETDGSIVCPATRTGIVGVKPTVGLSSRRGIIPLAPSQDTPGPMARTVRDAAILLGVLAGTDPADEATRAAGPKYSDYSQFLDADGLAGARIGVARNFAFDPGVWELFEEALEVLRGAGAVLVDPANVPNAGRYAGTELEVLLYEFKSALNAYLTAAGDRSPVSTLSDIIAFNERNPDTEMPFFGQELLIAADRKGPLTERAYLDALDNNRRYSRTEGIDALMEQHALDAITAPTGGPAWLTDHANGDQPTGSSSRPAAVAGYPSVTVPMGLLSGLPVGISFFGRACSEPVLLRLAYAFEQTTSHRRAPQFLQTIG